MKKMKVRVSRSLEAVVFLLLFFGIFGYLSHVMELSNMLNTMMNTAYQLIIKTVLYIMAITVLSGALGKLLIEFGVVRLIELIIRPLMKPIFNLPGVAALGGVLTFLSDNPAIISLSKDRSFTQYFKKYQLISFTNFGTAFGMGLVVLVFMAGLGYPGEALIGFCGAIVGSIVSTRLMQFYVLCKHPEFKAPVMIEGSEETLNLKSEGGVFLRVLNAILDGGKSGVDLGLAIIPGVLLISTFVMLLTFGPDEATGSYTGAAFEGVAILPWLAEKMNVVFDFLFGFHHAELVAFPITALGAVGAALGLVPKFQAAGFLDGNAIAVFTAIGMCWSGYLSTHTAMLDSLGYRKLTSKAILSHTIGGLAAGIVAHFTYLLFLG